MGKLCFLAGFSLVDGGFFGVLIFVAQICSRVGVGGMSRSTFWGVVKPQVAGRRFGFTVTSRAVEWHGQPVAGRKTPGHWFSYWLHCDVLGGEKSRSIGVTM